MTATKKLYLHVGHQKCGSTTIQHWLKKQEKNLEKMGIKYLKTGRGELGNSYVHHELALEVLTNNFKNGKNILFDNLQQEINNSDAEHFIISAENFIQITEKQQLQQLRDCFPNNLELHLVFIYRNQYQWLSSQWAQLAKNGITFDNFYAWFERFSLSLRALKYNEVCDFWDEYFQPSYLHILSFEDLVYSNSGLLSNFFDFIGIQGIPSDLLQESKNYNISPSYKTIILCQKIFSFMKETEELSWLFLQEETIRTREKISKYIQEFAQHRGFNQEKIDFMSLEQKKQVFDYYYGSNLELIDRFASRDKFRLFLKSPTESKNYMDIKKIITDLSPSLLNEAMAFVMVKLAEAK
jgi:hypothetical protein